MTQITDAMIDAGCRAWMEAGGTHCDSADLVGPIYTAMHRASSIPEPEAASELGRFGHHPDPAIDFCIEVEEIQSIAYDCGIHFPNPDAATLDDRIFRAMQFNVGGDEGAVNAKAALREIANRPEAASSDEDAVEEFLRETYGHAFKEGAESTVEQWQCDRSAPPEMPHKDCENEGAYQFIEDVKPKLLALLSRLSAEPEAVTLREQP